MEEQTITKLQVIQGVSRSGRNMSVKSILSTVLLSLQLCLGFWQIGKLTPVGALMQCGIGWFLSLCLLPLGLSPDYTRLKAFPGRMYKAVQCHVTGPADQHTVPRPGAEHSNINNNIRSSYLGVDFHLERREGIMLLLDGKMTYYITDPIWNSLLEFKNAAPSTVFLKGYKEFWQQVATGGVMTLSDVLDSLILENHSIKVLDNHLLLPVNLSVSEEKLLKFVNLLGLFLQTRQVYWLLPTLLSFTAAVMEFSTSLRAWLYGKINLCFCWGVHVVCDRLPRVTRRQIYSFGNWVENLKPSNDIRLRVMRGEICAVIGGGAKVHQQGATLMQVEVPQWLPGQLEQTQIFGKIICGEYYADRDPIDIQCWFDGSKAKFELKATTMVELNCSKDEFIKLLEFLTCVSNNLSGSLISCNSRNNVRVRGFRDSVACYSKNRFPPVYELKLEKAVVN